MADDLVITLTAGDWVGVGLATLAAFLIGFVWFTLLFGKRWAQEMGIPLDHEPTPKFMASSMAKDLAGNLVMAYVLFHSIAVWLPELWAAQLGTSAENSAMWLYGVWGGFFVWLGFFLPVSLSRTGWERRSWTWFAIDAGHHLVKLMVMAQILAAFM